jgi:hypothetical protein
MSKWMKPKNVKKAGTYIVVGGEHNSSLCGKIIGLGKDENGVYEYVCNNVDWERVYLKYWFEDIRLFGPLPELPDFSSSD